VTAGDYRFDIGTAGAAPLLMQTILLPLAHAYDDSCPLITGGTHVPHAPPADYLEAIYCRALERFGVEADVSYSQAGFFPKGGGKVAGQIGADPSPRPATFTKRGGL